MNLSKIWSTLFPKKEIKAPKEPLHIVTMNLLKNINSCGTYIELRSVEKYFTDKLIEYRDDKSVGCFKQTIESQIRIQSVYIQIRKNPITA